jgi:hypothetical protein
VTDQPAPTGKATIIGGSAGMAIAIALLAQFQIKNEGLPPANPDGTRPVYKDPVCTSTMVKLLRAGEPPIVWCSQFTEARSRFVPIQFPLAKDAKGNVLPMAQQPNAVSVPLHGWMVVGGRSCRDARAGCRGIVLRREREQAMCLGDVQAAMKF